MASAALSALRLAPALLAASHSALLPVVAAAFLSLLSLYFAFDSSSTELLKRMIVELRLAWEGSAGPRFSGLIAAVVDDAERFVVVQIVSGVLAFAVSWVLAVAVVEAAAAARSDREPTLSAVLAKLNLSWKRTLLTELTTTAFRFLYSLIFLSFLAFVALASDGSVPLLAPTAVLCLLSAAHFESVLHLSSVVSVLEKEHGGLSALWRATELRGSRRGDAFGLSLVLLPAGVVVSAGLYIVKGDGVWFGVAETCMCVAAATAVHAAWAAFYWWCVERKGEWMDEDCEKFGGLKTKVTSRVCAEEHV